MRRSDWFSAHPAALVLICAIAAAYGAMRITQSTPHGLGLIGDSFYYVTGADNLAAGRGFGRLNGGGEFIPTTHYPPGYSAAMASLQVVGMDKLESAVWVNLASFVVLIFAVGYLLHRATSRTSAAAAGVVLLGVSPVLLSSTIWVMSETFYLAVSMSGLLSLFIYVRSGRWTWFISAALLASAAYLTRYVGIALVGAMALTLIVRPATSRRRLVDVGIFLAIALLPMLAWLTRNAVLTGNLANRDVLWNPIGYGHLRSLALQLLSWFAPTQLIQGKSLRIASLGFLAIAGLWLLRRAKGTGEFRLGGSAEGMLAMYAVLYLAALGLSLSLFDAFTPIDDRILSPVFVALVCLGALLVARTWRWFDTVPRVAIALAVIGVAGWNAIEQARRAGELSGKVLGYASLSAGEAELIQAVRQLPQDVPVISNELSGLYFWADRYSYALPVRIDVESGLPRANYPADLEQMRRRLIEEGAVLVLFHPDRLLKEYAPLEELTRGLNRIASYMEGEIFRSVATRPVTEP